MKNNFYKSVRSFIFVLFLLILGNFFAWGQNYPVSALDGMKNSVVLNHRPEKIISFGAASTEILYEVGAGSQIAAVSDVCNFPEEACNLPKVGGFGVSIVSIETLLSFDPDFVIVYNGMQDYLIPSLKKYEIPFYISDANSIDDVILEIRTLAFLTGHEEQGLKLEKKYNAVVNQIEKNQKKKLNQKKKANHVDSVELPKVYWEVWYEPFMSAGGNSFINDVIRIAGGKNIFGEERQAYPIVSEETIIASNPDFILIPNDIFVEIDAVKARRGWNEISAVKNDDVILFNADVYTRPGPRIFDAIRELNKILYE